MTTDTMGVLQLSQRPAQLDDDRARLEAVYREHAAFVARCLGRLGVPDARLDDLVQDVFLVVHRRLPKFDASRGSMRSWLYGIARRVAANERRGAVRSHRRLELVRATPSDPSEMAREVEAARVVERFLDRLKPIHREVFVLSEIEGMSGPEVAEALGLNLNTAYARIRKTRRLFDQVAAHHRNQEARR